MTYSEASTRYQGTVGARERYEELTYRAMSADAAARLRERGEFDPDTPGHAALARREPLSAEDHLEMMAAGEFLARYYRHPAAVDDAVKAGASWEQIGAARGTTTAEAREEYRAWATGQHDLLGYSDGRFGMSDADYAAAMARAAETEAGQ